MSERNNFDMLDGSAPSAWLDPGYVVDHYLKDGQPEDPMDTEQMRAEHHKLLQWFYYEKDKQAANRMEMALDQMFYDNEQWDQNDSAILRARGQMPLVFNEVAPVCDWVIGTERRTRVDWKVLPRGEEDVQMADVKTKVLKYVSDINRCQFVRSQAFADSVKSGIGWIDDGARDDPTQDILYSKYEDWRNVIHDSCAYELDLSDARFIFRWRWVDEDVALALFPSQQNKIRRAIRLQQHGMLQYDDEWYLGDHLPSQSSTGTAVIGSFGSTGILAQAKRPRVKLIECQYKKPVNSKIVRSGPLSGSFVTPHDQVLHAATVGEEIIDRVVMRTHIAIFTEGDLLSLNESPYRHNRFSLTPIWCYRNARTRLPYGVVRRVRDIQMDLNKRASKSLFMMNTNQVILEAGAVDDLALLREEADSPDGIIVKNRGYELEIRRDHEQAAAQVQMMTLDAQAIQKTVGVNNENLGRQTNAISGAAIEARQNQGSVSTTEPFDNYRLAVQVSGEKQLSLTEQFYTEEKVIRISGARGQLEWVKVNQPETQPDGSVRYINDISASMADFVVSEADYAGTLRQVMFDSLNQLVQKLPPEVGLKLFTLALEFSDLPNHNDIASELRKMTGEPDPNHQPTPEEQQKMAQQQQMQAEALQMQREGAMLALEEQRAKVQKLQAEAQSLLAQPGTGESDQVVAQVRQEAAAQIDQLTQKLNMMQLDMASKTMQIQKEAEIKKYVADLEADTKLRITEIQRDSNEHIATLQQKLDELKHTREIDAKAESDKRQEAITAKADKQKADSESKAKAEKAAAEKPTPAPAPQPIEINVAIDAKSGEVKKQIKIKRDKAGKIIGADVEEDNINSEG